MKNQILENRNVTSSSAQIALLKQHFPACFDKEGNFLPDKMAEIAKAEGADISREGYSLNWLGKSYARLLANLNTETLLAANTEHNAKDENKDSENILIQGDNLDVLKHLKNAYSEQIKMIYIDPPYNTGSDGFVYQDDRKFSVEELSSLAGIEEGEAKRILDFTQSNSNSHSAWLTFMYPRLYIAKELLREDGVIFISIDENEQPQLKLLCDEIFGEDNFIECITWNKRIPKNDKGIGNIHEYVLLYVKQSQLKHEFLMRKDGLDEIFDLTQKLKRAGTSIPEAEREVKKLYKKNGYDRGITLYNSLDEDYELWGKINMSWPNPESDGPRYKVLHPESSKAVRIPDRGWRWKRETFDAEAGISDGKYKDIFERYDGSFVCKNIWFSNDENTQPSSITYLKNVSSFLLRSVLSLKSDGGVEVKKLFDGKDYFSRPKPTKLLKVLIGSIASDGDKVLDFFAGSGTTSHAVMEINTEEEYGKLKHISVQIDEKTDPNKAGYKAGYKTIFEITRDRILKAAEKIKAENPDATCDFGFKEFKTISVFDGYLDDADTSDQYDVFEGDKLTVDERAQLLLTWQVYDGLPITLDLEAVDLNGYTAHQGEHILYCINSNLSLNHIVAMLERIDSDADFAPQKIVIFEYILASKAKREITEAVKGYNNRKQIELHLEVRA